MIDFPSAERLDDSTCLLWWEPDLHPDGFACPYWHRAERRLFRQQGDFAAYRCRACEGYDTLRTDTVFEKTRQRPATLVLLRRGIAKGEPTARLARTLGRSRKPWPTRRHRVQANLNATSPTAVLRGTAFEADALDQKAGGNQPAASRPQRAATPPRQQAQRARDLH
jgi:hypothetical protein